MQPALSAIESLCFSPDFPNHRDRHAAASNLIGDNAKSAFADRVTKPAAEALPSFWYPSGLGQRPHANLLPMSVNIRPPMSVAEFLEWEEGQALKHEFDGFRPIAMSGGTTAHARIQRNLTIAVGSRLAGSRCEFLGSDIKIEVAGRIRYPNGFVVCSNPADDTTVHRNPVVIFEILSPSTAGTDLFRKNEEYAATGSVRRYVILAQEFIRATVFERIGGDWVGHILGAEAILQMPEIGIECPLAELYRGVDLSPAPGEAGSDSE